ncbi:1777_t:CDS:2, partial [Rhizophagus irregularis]
LEGQDALQLVETVPPYHAARDLDVPKLRNYYVFLKYLANVTLQINTI